MELRKVIKQPQRWEPGSDTAHEWEHSVLSKRQTTIPPSPIKFNPNLRPACFPTLIDPRPEPRKKVTFDEDRVHATRASSQRTCHDPTTEELSRDEGRTRPQAPGARDTMTRHEKSGKLPFDQTSLAENVSLNGHSLWSDDRTFSREMESSDEEDVDRTRPFTSRSAEKRAENNLLSMLSENTDSMQLRWKCSLMWNSLTMLHKSVIFDTISNSVGARGAIRVLRLTPKDVSKLRDYQLRVRKRDTLEMMSIVKLQQEQRKIMLATGYGPKSLTEAKFRSFFHHYLYKPLHQADDRDHISTVAELRKAEKFVTMLGLTPSFAGKWDSGNQTTRSHMGAAGGVLADLSEAMMEQLALPNSPNASGVAVGQKESRIEIQALDDEILPIMYTTSMKKAQRLKRQKGLRSLGKRTNGEASGVHSEHNSAAPVDVGIQSRASQDVLLRPEDQFNDQITLEKDSGLEHESCPQVSNVTSGASGREIAECLQNKSHNQNPSIHMSSLGNHLIQEEKQKVARKTINPTVIMKSNRVSAKESLQPVHIT